MKHTKNPIVKGLMAAAAATMVACSTNQGGNTEEERKCTNHTNNVIRTGYENGKPDGNVIKEGKVYLCPDGINAVIEWSDGTTKNANDEASRSGKGGAYCGMGNCDVYLGK